MQEPLVASVPITVASRLAGFLVADAARLRFVATDRRFGVLDGSRFWRPRDAQSAAERLARLVGNDEPSSCPQRRLPAA